MLKNVTLEGHTGLGVIRYEEHVSPTALVPNPEADYSDASMPAVIIGLYGEYNLPKYQDYYIAFKSDWIWGLEDDEEWTKNYAVVNTDDLQMFNQFYDIRGVYKNTIERYHFSLFLSGGWDGMYFRRDNIVKKGIPQSGVSTEEFSLWRIGGGLGIGYDFDEWTVDGEVAYGYYFDGEIRNDGNGVYETNGYRLDSDIGVSYKLTENLTLYIGGGFTFIELEQDEEIKTFPNSETEIFAAIVGLTYEFE